MFRQAKVIAFDTLSEQTMGLFYQQLSTRTTWMPVTDLHYRWNADDAFGGVGGAHRQVNVCWVVNEIRCFVDVITTLIYMHCCWGGNTSCGDDQSSICLTPVGLLWHDVQILNFEDASTQSVVIRSSTIKRIEMMHKRDKTHMTFPSFFPYGLVRIAIGSEQASKQASEQITNK